MNLKPESKIYQDNKYDFKKYGCRPCFKELPKSMKFKIDNADLSGVRWTFTKKPGQIIYELFNKIFNQAPNFKQENQP
jgi:hypothetical protein